MDARPAPSPSSVVSARKTSAGGGGPDAGDDERELAPRRLDRRIERVRRELRRVVRSGEGGEEETTLLALRDDDPERRLAPVVHEANDVFSGIDLVGATVVEA